MNPIEDADSCVPKNEHFNEFGNIISYVVLSLYFICGEFSPCAVMHACIIMARSRMCPLWSIWLYLLLSLNTHDVWPLRHSTRASMYVYIKFYIKCYGYHNGRREKIARSRLISRLISHISFWTRVTVPTFYICLTDFVIDANSQVNSSE